LRKSKHNYKQCLAAFSGPQDFKERLCPLPAWFWAELKAEKRKHIYEDFLEKDGVAYLQSFSTLEIDLEFRFSRVDAPLLVGVAGWLGVLIEATTFFKVVARSLQMEIRMSDQWSAAAVNLLTVRIGLLNNEERGID